MTDLLPDARCPAGIPSLGDELERIVELGQELRRVPVGETGAGSLQARGVWHLLWWSREGALDRSMELLHQAADRAPRAPDILSDLAAAYLTRAVVEDRPADLFRALSHSRRAIELAPDDPTPLFNHALVLSRMFAEAAASRAWSSYLRIDADSPWSGEARRRRSSVGGTDARSAWQSLRRALASDDPAARRAAVAESAERFPQQARQHVEEVLLPAWARALPGTGSSAGLEELHLARELARRLDRGSGDRLLLESVDRIRETMKTTTETDHSGRSIARALLDYRDGRSLHDEQQYGAAAGKLEPARDGLRSRGIPLHLWAEFYLAVGAYHAPDYPRAHRELTELARTARQLGYAALEAYSHWMLGLVEGRRSRYGTALGHFDAASTVFGRLGEVENVAAVRALSAFVYFALGDGETAWSHLYRALSSRPAIQSSRRLQNILAEAVDALQRSAMPDAAVPYQTDLVGLALASGSPLSSTLALRRRSRLLAGQGDAAAARADLEEAWRLSESIPSPGLQAGIRADLLIAEAQLSRQFSPETSVARLTAALDYHLEARDRHLLIQIFRERAGALRDLGRHAEAGADLRAGAAELEEQWREIDPGPRERFFQEQARGIFEGLVAIEVAGGRGETAALELVERMRALPDARSSRTETRIDEVCEALPEQSAAVTYLVTDSELLAWVHSTGCRLPRLVRTAVPGREISRLANSLYDSFAGGGSAEALELSRRLWQLLVAPVLPHLRGARTLIIVPDDSLHRVPFSALRPAAGEAFLVEEFALTIAPSLQVFAGHHRSYHQLAETPAESILVIADPAIDRDLFPTLPPLPDSLAEAASICELYGRPTLLAGNEATPARVFAAMPGAEVLHFSGHALSPRSAGAPPGLLLGADGAELAVLAADRLAGLDLGRTRLAFLGACSTAGGGTHAVAAPASLARAFLDHGVPAVIATLWDVEDRRAARLSRRFHAAYRSGMPPAQALQAAQLELLHDRSARDRHSFSWAAFQLYGGAT